MYCPLFQNKTLESRHRTSSLNTADSEHASGAFDPETRRKSVYQCEYEYVISSVFMLCQSFSVSECYWT